MRTLLSLGATSLWLTLVPVFLLEGEQCPVDDDDTPYSSRLLVGASSVSILPEVDGSTDYFASLEISPLAMEPGDDGRDPGLFIEQWDVGTLSIGNGMPSSHWVHDDIRASAVVLEDLDQVEGKRLVLVSVDVYMMFRQDIEEAFDKIRRKLGDADYNTLHIVIGSTHNHMGPDTSGMSGLNHDYYRYLTDQIANAVVEAFEKRESATMTVAASRYQFGMADASEPNIVDPTLHSLRFNSKDTPGKVLATVVQWQSHPEETLSFGRDIYATADQSAYLQSIDECFSDDGVNCYVEDQIISAGFAGYAAFALSESTAAPALVFNGPVGGLLGPLHAVTWETEGPTGQPAGDGTVVPPNADIIGSNFHQAAVDGLELAKRVEADLAAGELVEDPPISMNKVEFYSRLTNIAYRFGLSLTVTGNPFMLGHLPRELFVCPATGQADDTTCVSDNYEAAPDPILAVPVRVGTHGKTEAHYLRLGPVGIITLPGEGFSELVEGLPADYVQDPRQIYFPSAKSRFNHVPAESYVIPGYARQAMPERYRLAIGLANDELGYMRPFSDWRSACVADEDMLGGVAGNCAALYAAGLLDYINYDGDEYAISGARCRQITENPSLLEQPPYTDIPNGAALTEMNCRYGQLFGADGHYEETNSCGWDFAENWMSAVKVLTGFSGDMAQTNPDFIGYNVHE